jgi:hypothetical protein
MQQTDRWQMQKQQKPNGKALSVTLRRQLEALVDAKGEAEAIKELGLSRQALYRAMAGRTIHRGTASLVEAFVAAGAK